MSRRRTFRSAGAWTRAAASSPRTKPATPAPENKFPPKSRPMPSSFMDTVCLESSNPNRLVADVSVLALRPWSRDAAFSSGTLRRSSNAAAPPETASATYLRAGAK